MAKPNNNSNQNRLIPKSVSLILKLPHYSFSSPPVSQLWTFQLLYLCFQPMFKGYTLQGRILFSFLLLQMFQQEKQKAQSLLIAHSIYLLHFKCSNLLKSTNSVTKGNASWSEKREDSDELIIYAYLNSCYAQMLLKNLHAACREESFLILQKQTQ